MRDDELEALEQCFEALLNNQLPDERAKWAGLRLFKREIEARRRARKGSSRPKKPPHHTDSPQFSYAVKIALETMTETAAKKALAKQVKCAESTALEDIRRLKENAETHVRTFYKNPEGSE